MAHILVADDDDLLGELLRFKLEAAGHRVTTIGDGRSALDAALTVGRLWDSVKNAEMLDRIVVRCMACEARFTGADLRTLHAVVTTTSASLQLFRIAGVIL